MADEMKDPAAKAADTCCGGVAPSGDACCAADEKARAAGEPGCGCGVSTDENTPAVACCG